MKFEKLTNDKIKITLNSADLKANNIDCNSFMSDATKTQSLFLTVLDRAEKEYGFITENYKLKIETLALDNNSFILTITRSLIAEQPILLSLPKKCTPKRIYPKLHNKSLLYKFDSFDNFYDFINYLYGYNINNIDDISKTSTLYLYQKNYFLLFNNINFNYDYFQKITTSLSEFSEFIEFTDSMSGKLHEFGSVVIKNKVITNAINHFIS